MNKVVLVSMMVLFAFLAVVIGDSMAAMMPVSEPVVAIVAPR